jgi:hypothetical protein
VSTGPEQSSTAVLPDPDSVYPAFALLLSCADGEARERVARELVPFVRGLGVEVWRVEDIASRKLGLIVAGQVALARAEADILLARLEAWAGETPGVTDVRVNAWSGREIARALAGARTSEETRELEDRLGLRDGLAVESLDDATTLAEAAAAASDPAERERLHGLAAAGWELDGPLRDGYGEITRSLEAALRVA